MEPQGTPTPSEQPNRDFDAPKPAENSEAMPVAAPTQSEPVGTPPVPNNQMETPQVIVPPAPVDSVTNAAPTGTSGPSETPFAATQPAVTALQPDAQPVVGGSVASMPPSGRGRKKRWILPVALAAIVVLVLAGGYAFAFYLPNQPGAVYSSSLKRTGEAVDTLVNYSNTQAQKHYKSYGVDGKLSITADGTSFDTTLSGSADTKTMDATATLNADIMGEHVSADVRSVHVAGSVSPDIYLRASGIKTALDAAGAGSLDGLDGQWLSIDHTLLNSYAANYSSKASALTGSLPSAAQSHDAAVKIQAVNKQYLFTTDKTHAVLQNKKYIGKETKDGRSVYHYTVGYDKAHLKAYVGALSSSLDASSLNSWAKKVNDGQSLSDMLDVSSLKSSIDGAKSSYTFDVWVDAKTKLIQSMQFSDPSQPSSVFTLAQNYTGSGTSYPFSFSYQGKDKDGSRQSASVKLAVDTTTNKETGTVAFDASSAKVNLTFSLTPSTKDVAVTAPTGAQSVLDLLSGLGLGSL